MSAASASMDFSSVTAEGLLVAASSWEVQLTLAVLHALLWHGVLHHVLPAPLRRGVTSLQSLDQVVQHNAVSLKRFILPSLSLPEDRDFVIDFVVDIYSILFQHLIGGLLCLPALLGVGPPSVTSALACHGALCEVGFEIQDTLVRIKSRVCDGELGRKKNPSYYLMLLAMHHTAALCMVLPMNVYYRDNRHYHESVFLLQGAAAIAYFCQQYGYTRDVTIRWEMMQLKASVILTCLAMVYTRVLRGLYLWYVLLCTFLADGQHTVLKLALFPLVLMTCFNLVLVGDAVRKFQKLVLETPLPEKVERSVKTERACEVHVPTQTPTLLGRIGRTRATTEADQKTIFHRRRNTKNA